MLGDPKQLLILVAQNMTQKLDIASVKMVTETLIIFGALTHTCICTCLHAYVYEHVSVPKCEKHAHAVETLMIYQTSNILLCIHLFLDYPYVYITECINYIWALLLLAYSHNLYINPLSAAKRDGSWPANIFHHQSVPPSEFSL